MLFTVVSQLVQAEGVWRYFMCCGPCLTHHCFHTLSSSLISIFPSISSSLFSLPFPSLYFSFHFLSSTPHYHLHTFHFMLLKLIWLMSDTILLSFPTTDNTASIWDVDTGNILMKYVGHSGSVNSIAFHPTEHYPAPRLVIPQPIYGGVQ